MARYRRLLEQGGTFFFTVVTERREPLFFEPPARELLGSVYRRLMLRLPTRTVAIVLLPDHLHC